MEKSNSVNKYLCKGRTFDEGKWITGYPVFIDAIEKNEKGEDVKISVPYLSNFSEKEGFNYIPVIPMTLCRLVGAFDIDRKPVFVGDKLRQVVDLRSDDEKSKSKYYKPINATAHDFGSGFGVLIDGEGSIDKRILNNEVIIKGFRVIGNEWDDLEFESSEKDLVEQEVDSNIKNFNPESDNLLSMMRDLKPGEEIHLGPTKGDIRLEEDENGNVIEIPEESSNSEE